MLRLAKLNLTYPACNLNSVRGHLRVRVERGTHVPIAELERQRVDIATRVAAHLHQREAKQLLRCHASQLCCFWVEARLITNRFLPHPNQPGFSRLGLESGLVLLTHVLLDLVSELGHLVLHLVHVPLELLDLNALF